MRVTARRTDFFRLLARARWLTTSQVHRRFFAHATRDATCKWLRQGVKSRYLVGFRENRMSEIRFTLGPEGKRVLEQVGFGPIRLERKPPNQLAHLSGINDLRIAAELAGSLSYFFGYWELPGLGWQFAIIPDAVLEFAGKTFAAEFDRGSEAVRFFLRTKVAVYERGLEGLPLTSLIVITDRRARMKALLRAVAGRRLPILLSPLENIRRHDLGAPIFYRHGDDQPVRLI